MSLSFRQEARQELRQEQRLTQKQKLKLAEVTAQLLLDLSEEFHGLKFEPTASCPQCGRKLKLLEILNGFRNDPTDVTTRCPSCARRFQPSLKNFGRFSSIEVSYFCPVQTLDRLESLAGLSVEEIRKTNPSVYYSALAHFGGLKQAFAKLGITYDKEKEIDWRKAVEPYLGKLPDPVIAEHAGVKTYQVGYLRRKLGLPAYSKRQALEEIGERDETDDENDE
ncbi:MAG: hypothetical protein ABIJ46_03985 [bacterium]